jgi:hypothetical protein
MMTIDLYNISMVSTTYNDKTVKVDITLPHSLIKQTDKTWGDVKRSTHIRRAIKNYLKHDTCDSTASSHTDQCIKGYTDAYNAFCRIGVKKYPNGYMGDGPGRCPVKVEACTGYMDEGKCLRVE